MDENDRKQLIMMFDRERQLCEQFQELRKKQDDLDRDKSRVAHKLYVEFIKNNWHQLRNDAPYYYVYLDMEKDNWVAQKIRFSKKWETLAEFHPCGPQKMNINLHVDVDEKDYESISVVVDEKQFEELEIMFKFRML